MEVEPQAVSLVSWTRFRKTAFQVHDEVAGRVPIAITDHPRAHQFRVGIDGNPRPAVARWPFFKQLVGYVLLLRADKGPDFVALNALAFQVHQRLVEIISACCSTAPWLPSLRSGSVSSARASRPWPRHLSTRPSGPAPRRGGSWSDRAGQAFLGLGRTSVTSQPILKIPDVPIG
jgi:hypothetical protein